MRPIATRAATIGILMVVSFEDGVARHVDESASHKATLAWISREDCERAAPLPREDGEARLASWNIRWFPDGTEDDALSPDEHTDVDWLACAIAHLNVDVIAVQEFKKHTRARERASRLLSLLDARTHGSWDLVLDDCPDENQPHVGFLYDSSRIKGDSFWQIDHLNPFPDRCGGAANAGFAGTFRWPGGLDVTLVNVHAVAGASQKTGTLRLHTFESLETARHAAMDYGKDEDIIFLGDFNTVGMASNPMAATREILMLAASFAAHTPPLMLLSTDTPCTEYSDGNSWWLDHMAMPKAMHEANTPRIEVEGYCAQLRCIVDEDSKQSQAHNRLSDHCPIVLTLEDIDIDVQYAINP